jgi:hypothetical protein
MRSRRAWLVTCAATAASTYALDATATAVGMLLVASQLLDGLGRVAAIALLAGSYGLWGLGMAANLRANWSLLERTAVSTNALSKAAFELTRACGERLRRGATAAGYVGTELTKEAAYYGGAAGVAAFSATISTTDALVFLAGTNLGAAAYEYALARATRALLARRRPART